MKHEPEAPLKETGSPAPYDQPIVAKPKPDMGQIRVPYVVVHFKSEKGTKTYYASRLLGCTKDEDRQVLWLWCGSTGYWEVNVEDIRAISIGIQDWEWNGWKALNGPVTKDMKMPVIS